MFIREGFKKKNCEKAVRLTALGGEGGSPPLSLTTSICENFDPFLSFIKRQNNPKYGNLSRNFHIFLTASGEGRGGSTQAVSLTAFSQFFFLNPSLTTSTCAIVAIYHLCSHHVYFGGGGKGPASLGMFFLQRWSVQQICLDSFLEQFLPKFYAPI